jgi:hypothetical protein
MNKPVCYSSDERDENKDMSLVKGTQEFRTILDFSKGEISKNMIKNALRSVEVLEVVRLKDSNTITFVENDIIVGMYQIRLIFDHLDANRNRTKLREYGMFRIAVFERSYKTNSIHNINLLTDRRFKDQYWSKLNRGYDLRIQNLVDIIMFVKRLNNLKLFL